MGGAYSVHGEKEWRIQGFGEETWGKEANIKTQAKMEDNIKMDLQEVGCGVWDG